MLVSCETQSAGAPDPHGLSLISSMSDLSITLFLLPLLAGALVLAWYLFGVFAQQENPAIHWTSLGLGIAVATYTMKPFVFRLAGRHTGETAPLLG